MNNVKIFFARDWKSLSVPTFAELYTLKQCKVVELCMYVLMEEQDRQIAYKSLVVNFEWGLKF